MTKDIIKFDLPKNQSSIIKVMGVGGGGSNAVNHMFRQGIQGVDFFVCNTDSQALENSPVPNKIQMGVNLTEGRGAGSIPEVGRRAALEDIERIRDALGSHTKMLFITAGMGGGTGTGAAPIIAKTSKEMDILTVGIVTIPFSFEGRKRRQQAEEGIQELTENVDTLLIICNDRLRELYGNLSVSEAFGKADNVLTTGAKGIAEIITLTGNINVDFADVKTVMSGSGVAIMGNGSAEGENRSIKAVETALSSPLLNDNQIIGAKNILLNITSGKEEVLMDEITEITDYINDEAGGGAEIIWGLSKDESLEAKVSVTLVATGFDAKKNFYEGEPRKNKKVVTLEENKTKGEDKQQSFEWEGPFEENKDANEQMTLRIKNDSQSDDRPETRRVHTRTLTKEQTEQFKQTLSEQSTYVRPGERQGDNPLTEEEAESRLKEREERLKDLSIRMKTPEGLADLENQPAFIRRKISLSPVPASDETHVSRFTLNESKDKQTQIKSNNSFLHDNVD